MEHSTVDVVAPYIKEYDKVNQELTQAKQKIWELEEENTILIGELLEVSRELAMAKAEFR